MSSKSHGGGGTRGLVMTIASDEEVEPESEGESDVEKPATQAKAGKKRQRPKDGDDRTKSDGLDPSFSFDLGISVPGAKELQAIQGWDFKSAISKLAQQDPRRARTGEALDARIAAKRSELRKARRRAKHCVSKEKTKTDMDVDGEEAGNPTENGNDVETRVPHSNPTERQRMSGDEVENEGQQGDEEEGIMEEDALRELSTGVREKRNRRIRSENTDRGNTAERDVVDEDESADVDDEAEEEARKAAVFFEDGDEAVAGGGEGDVAQSDGGGIPFQQLNLSRPLLRAVDAMGFVHPTPIQQRAIPFALAGRDVCASATTGSGKTAAFLLPILERLLFRPKKIAVTRVLIITPTRELGVQIDSMCKSLSQFTDIASALIVGGNKNIKAQEAELRARPDIVVCTPGRMVDHLTNSASVHLDDVEILVLDEADRLLELGFQEEVAELVRSCPVGRQTLLFSATMNTKVDDLASLALNKPVRIRASPINSAPQRLIQEFVRIRQSREQDREAIFLSLLSRTFKTRTIAFFDTKALAHRLNIILGLAGIKSAELHGNLAMTQRLEALDRFKSGDVTVLVATDLAARGLDITGVHTVINFEMPRSADSYIHRVGRTARAGCGGRSVTLIGESRRIVMKDVLKTQGSGVEIKSRAVPQSAIDHFRSKVEGMEESIASILEDEKVEREARYAAMEADRATNIMEHNKEILSRPARQWIVSEHRKGQIAEKARAEATAESLKASGGGNEAMYGQTVEKGNSDQGAAKKEREKKLHRMTRKKRRRLMAQEAEEKRAREEAEELRAQGKQVSSLPSSKSLVISAKREARAAEMKAADTPLSQLRGARRKLDVGSGSAFEFDMSVKKPTAYTDSDKDGGKGRTKTLGNESRYNFTEFDPNRRLKRRAKKGSAKFKSKAKFKRKK